MSNQLSSVSRIAQIIEEAAAKSSGRMSTGIPTLSHLQAAEQIAQEADERVERLQKRVAELERDKDNMLRVIGALVVQSGGKTEISRSAMLEDYMVHEIEDVVTGGIKVKAEVYVPCKNDRR